MSTETLMKTPHAKTKTPNIPNGQGKASEALSNKPPSESGTRASSKHLNTGKKSQHNLQTSSQANTLSQWLSMSRTELDALYKKAKPGALPQGDTIGTAILAGGPFPKLFSKLAKQLAWQGKVFDLFAPDYNSGVLVNKVSPIGVSMIVAKVYRGASWMDGKETIIIDYSGTSLFARQIRDEIREVKPGLYLGKVWWGKTRVLDFALQAHQVMPA